MVLLHLRTDNTDNFILSKFDSLYDSSYIQFSNAYNNIYLQGLSNNSFKIVNINNINDNGLIYNNNTLNVKTLNSQFLSHNNYTVFPNDYTIINSYVITEPISISGNGAYNCFDLNSVSFWRSAPIYEFNTGRSLTTNPIYKFQEDFGHWIKIKFPYQIIPVGFGVNSTSQLRDPASFAVYVSNDDVTWKRILIVEESNYRTNFYFADNTDFYTYVAIVITKVNTETINENYQYFNIYELKVYSRPILNIDTKIKITNNNIYDIETINTKKLFLNNVPIGSVGDINNAAINAAIDAFKKEYSFFWKNTNNIGYFDSNIINKIAISKNANANAILDVNGDITYINRSLNKYLTVSIGPTSLAYSSSYIYIGKIDIKSSVNKNYFKIKLVSFDLTKYYFQTIEIEGYVYINTNVSPAITFKVYWNTAYDNSTTIQRITDVVYTIDIVVSPIISFYVRYNPLLDITFSSQNSQSREAFENVIYIDEVNTKYGGTVEFTPSSSATETILISNFFNATLVNSIVLNENTNTFNNIHINNNIKLINTNTNTNNSNFLIVDRNKNIIDSKIPLQLLSNINVNDFNKVIGIDNKGSLITLETTNSLLSNISFISKLNSRMLVSANGLFEPLVINKDNYSNLTNINETRNSILIINNTNELKTTTSVNIHNISNVLQLFTFPSFVGSNVIANNDITIRNFYVNNNLNIGNIILTSNNNYNRIYVNNKEIGEDIFKKILKIPNTDDINPIVSIIPVTNILTNIRKYNIRLNNNFNIVVEVDDNDDEEADINVKIFNIFNINKNKNKFWKTQNNFYNFNTYGAAKFLYNDNALISRCGAFFIVDIGKPFILTHYSFFVSYTDLNKTIKDFKVFGFDNNTWVELDNKTNVVLINHLTPNVFIINKTNYRIFTKYAFCIIATHNSTFNPDYCVLNNVEIYGYSINDYYNNTSNNIIYNSENTTTVLGYTNVGISNLNPLVPLSIGNDIIYNSTEGLLNLNHPSVITNANIEKPIITITRPSYNNNNNGIKAVHYLNSWSNNNTTYTIKLSHSNLDNEKIILSMNSDGKIGIGGIPDSNLNKNGISIFNNNGISFYNNSSNFINIHPSSNLLDNYTLVFPSNMGVIDNCLTIESINNKIIYYNWSDPLSNLLKRPVIKFGDQRAETRNDSKIVFQVAGSCLIGGAANTTPTSLSSNFMNNNALVVAGSIYSTTDITTDSDLSYKYNIKIISKPMEIIKNINGYTFNRNDTGDDNRYTGLIAQEVEKVLPEVILKKHDGKLRIIYANMAGLFVEAFKDVDNTCNYLNFKLNCCMILFLIITMAHYVLTF